MISPNFKILPKIYLLYRKFRIRKINCFYKLNKNKCMCVAFILVVFVFGCGVVLKVFKKIVKKSLK
jgi:hypothetical protein